MLYAANNFVHVNIFPNHVDLHRLTFYSCILSNLLNILSNLLTITITIFNLLACKTGYMWIRADLMPWWKQRIGEKRRDIANRSESSYCIEKVSPIHQANKEINPNFSSFFITKSQQEQQSHTWNQRHILNSGFLPASCSKGGTFNKLCYIWKSHLNSVISTRTMRANCACLCVHSSGRGSLMNCVSCNCKSSFILSVLCHVMLWCSFQHHNTLFLLKISSPSFIFS